MKLVFDKRNRRIKQLADQGLTYAEIGRKVGLSKSRVFQILKQVELEPFPEIDLFPRRYGILDWLILAGAVGVVAALIRALIN